VAEAICVKLAALILAFTGVLVEVEGNKDQREISHDEWWQMAIDPENLSENLTFIL